MSEVARNCCWRCDWWGDSGDTTGSCSWVVTEGLPFWAEVAEPAAKAGVDGYYTHFDAGQDCVAFRARSQATTEKVT